jgi:hypothetical protein
MSYVRSSEASLDNARESRVRRRGSLRRCRLGIHLISSSPRARVPRCHSCNLPIPQWSPNVPNETAP